MKLREVLGLFLKLGLIGFGGPAAHIAMMEDEVVRRRGWLTREKFLDLMGATNLIPGPNSTEMAIHIGHQVCGWRGLVLAGAGFILPAVCITTLLAWMYVEWRHIPQAEWVLYGVKPVVIAVVVQALWSFVGTALKGWRPTVLALAAGVLALLGVNELLLLLGAALIWGGAKWIEDRRPTPRPTTLGAIGAFPLLTAGQEAVAEVAKAGVAPAGAATAGAIAAGAAAFGLWPLFVFFLKVGSILYGSGYVLLAFLEGDLVERFGWLTRSQLLDAVAIGQITPGPVFTTATFIGYVLGGLPGALVATAGIFLPAFVFVAVSGPLIPHIRRSPVAGAVLDGVIAASLGLMAAVTLQLGQAALVDVPTVLVAVAAAAALIRFKMNSAWLVFGGAAFGLGAWLAQSITR